MIRKTPLSLNLHACRLALVRDIVEHGLCHVWKPGTKKDGLFFAVRVKGELGNQQNLSPDGSRSRFVLTPFIFKNTKLAHLFLPSCPQSRLVSDSIPTRTRNPFPMLPDI